MHSPTIIVLSLVLGFLTCSDTSLQSVDPGRETPSEVVAKYVSFARSGEFDKVSSLTVPSTASNQKSAPKSTNPIPENKKKDSDSKASDGFTVVPDPEVSGKATRDWITGDFAKSIYDEKLSIKSVKNESKKDNEARVEIILGNDKVVGLLGWVFLLRKVDDQWKIYNITTAGDSLAPLK